MRKKTRKRGLFFSHFDCSLIENLSDEVFYEIFDYLHGYEIHQAFSSLNRRFENLLLSSSFLLKMKFSSTTVFDRRYQELIHSNKSRIRSLHFSHEPITDRFISLCMIDSSFIHLQSIVLNPISTFKLVVLLFYLKALPCLFSLTVSLSSCNDDFGDIYLLILRLPVLKHLKINIWGQYKVNIPVPIATDEEFSSIEYLVIDHCCSLNALTDLLSYTPRLSHLYCWGIANCGDDDVKLDVLKRLSNLVQLVVRIHYFQFDDLEDVLLELCSRLERLKITIQYPDKDFLDSQRWEKLIVDNMPQLRRFILYCVYFINDDFQVTPSHSLINGFKSSFWIDRQWIFSIEIENNALIYKIHPYK